MTRRAAALLPLLLLLAPAWAGDEPSIPTLLDRVRDGGRAQFEASLDALAAMGPDAAAAAPALVADLVPPDESRRERIVETLVAIGAPAVPALTRGLMSWSGFVRVGCARALGRLGADAAPAVPLLVESLGDEPPDRQTEILRALGGIGPAAAGALPALEQLLETPSIGLRTEVVRALGRLGPRAVPLLIRVAMSQDEALAREARRALGAPEAPAALPPAAAPDLERLGKALQEGGDARRLAAARTIAALGPRAAALAPALLAALAAHDPPAEVRRAVVLALARVGGDGEKTVRALRRALATDPEVGATVLLVLPDLGAAALASLPDVAARLEDPALRLPAARTLVRFGDAATPWLVEAAKHASFRVREIAVQALAGTQRPVEARREALAAALDDEASCVRFAAAYGLGSLGAAAAPAVPALRRRLADESEGVRVAAARAMFAAGERGAELAPAFVEGLTSRTSTLSEGMDERLAALGEAALPALLDALERRIVAAGILEDVGRVLVAIGRPALPGLAGVAKRHPDARAVPAWIRRIEDAGD